MSTYVEDAENKFGFSILHVKYLLYFFDNIDDYNRNVMDVGYPEADRDTQAITIRGGIIEGYFNHTITQAIYHELEHIFQYGMGMQKRENLYDYIVNVIKFESNVGIVAAANLLYRTFPHEQDAFVHQFYGLIKNEQLKPSFGMFEEYLETYSQYRAFAIYETQLRDALKQPNNGIRSFLSTIGMTMKTFNKRIHFGKKRLKNKLFKAFQRYCIERRNRYFDEHFIRDSVLRKLLESYHTKNPNMKLKEEKYLL